MPDFECRGGPLDGERRAELTGGATRLYLQHRRVPASSYWPIHHEEALVPPIGPAWMLDGWYELRRVNTARFGYRTLWCWRAALSARVEKPFEPPPSKPFEPPTGGGYDPTDDRD